ncbi:MAG: MlrC C-terminal domain-containing protein, partial [Myxococcota bacterium]
DPLPIEGVIASRHAHTVLGGRTVVVRSGGVSIVLTADTPIAIGPDFYRDVGLRPTSQDAIVVKSLMAFRFYLALQNRRSLFVQTRGVTDLGALRSLSFDVPVHPLVDLDDWRPADRQRRALGGL